MDLAPSETDWALAKSVYDAFSQKPGAQHIASEFALAHLSALVNRVRPEAVLEFGAGIGTITYFLLNHPAKIGHVTTTEGNAFCLEQLAANIPTEYSGRYDIVVDDGALATEKWPYKIVIVDSSVSRRGYGFLDRGMTCFVEGKRLANRQEIEDELAGRGLRCNFVNYRRGPKLFSVAMRRSKKYGISYPKFSILKVPKGCWIGTVEAR